METQSIAQLQTLHPLIRDKAIDAYNKCVKLTPIGVHPYITEGLRTFERSADLYAQGRTNPGQIVTNAKAGQSWHNYGLAFDFAIQRNGKFDWTVGHDWMVCVNIFKGAGFAWGGDWQSLKDYPHFEMRFGLTTKMALARYEAKDFIAGTKYIRI